MNLKLKILRDVLLETVNNIDAGNTNKSEEELDEIINTLTTLNNAQYHDYVKLYKDWFTNITKEELDDKIITSCINFWFKDEDAGVGKVWNYFKNIG